MHFSSLSLSDILGSKTWGMEGRGLNQTFGTPNKGVVTCYLMHGTSMILSPGCAPVLIPSLSPESSGSSLLTNVHICVCVCVCACVCVCVCVYVYLCVYASVSVCVRLQTGVCRHQRLRMCPCVCVCVHLNMCKMCVLDRVCEQG